MLPQPCKSSILVVVQSLKYSEYEVEWVPISRGRTTKTCQLTQHCEAILRLFRFANVRRYVIYWWNLEPLSSLMHVQRRRDIFQPVNEKTGWARDY
jgi:hypothetical protein